MLAKDFRVSSAFSLIYFCLWLGLRNSLEEENSKLTSDLLACKHFRYVNVRVQSCRVFWGFGLR